MSKVEITTKQDNLAQDLRQLGMQAGLAAVGFASADDFDSARKHLEIRKSKGYSAGMNFTYKNPKRSTSPRATLPSARSLIVGAYSYNPAAGNSFAEAGEVADNRLAQTGEATNNNKAIQKKAQVRIASYVGQDYYEKLRTALAQIANRLKQEGYKAVVVVDDNALMDREAATRAGLGWHGKNTNIIIPNKGSWFVLGSVITDADFKTEFNNKFPDRLPVDECGACQKCITECPTGAILDGRIIDARKCLAWLLQREGVFPAEYRIALNDRIYGCDDCQTSCPKNYPGKQDHTETTTLEPNSQAPTVFEILDSTDAQLLERFGKWYIPNRDPKYIRRNALVILGNICESNDAHAKEILKKYLCSDEPILRAHAVWAAKRLKQLALLDILKTETDPIVLEELDLTVQTA